MRIMCYTIKTTSPGRTPTLFEKWSGIFYVHRMLLSYTRDRRVRLKVSSERLSGTTFFLKLISGASLKKE